MGLAYLDKMQYDNKRENYYKNLRPEMRALLPDNAKRVLDVGCGQGAMSRGIKKDLKIEVWGVEFMKEEAREACNHLDKVITATAEDSIEHLPDNYFDVIYFNDVLEHLVSPENVLRAMRSKLTPDGVIISSIPNARYHSVFFQYVVKKDWKYAKEGVMDYTHLRFFTSRSIQAMFEATGYKIEFHCGINRTRSLKPLLYNIPLLFTAMDMFYLQYATVARKIPTFDKS